MLTAFMTERGDLKTSPPKTFKKPTQCLTLVSTYSEYPARLLTLNQSKRRAFDTEKLTFRESAILPNFRRCIGSKLRASSPPVGILQARKLCRTARLAPLGQDLKGLFGRKRNEKNLSTRGQKIFTQFLKFHFSMPAKRKFNFSGNSARRPVRRSLPTPPKQPPRLRRPGNAGGAQRVPFGYFQTDTDDDIFYRETPIVARFA